MNAVYRNPTGERDLLSGLESYVRVRWAMLLALVVVLVAVLPSRHLFFWSFPHHRILYLAGLGGAMNLLYHAWLKTGAGLPILAYFVVFIDPLGLAAAVHFTGGADSNIEAAYGMIVIAAGILLGARMSFVAALTSALSYMGVLALEYWGILKHLKIESLFLVAELERPSLRSVLSAGVSTSAMMFGYAYVSAFLADLVRTKAREAAEAHKRRHELLKRFVSVQEAERQRIARELHDEMGQSLSALIFNVELAEKLRGDLPPAGDSLDQALGRVKSIAESALGSVHRLVFDLRPSLLDDLGLESAIRWYLKAYVSSCGVDAVLMAKGSKERLPSELETVLFRVVQEALSNVLKHSRATGVEVSLEVGPREVVAQVSDNGRGFDPASTLGSSDHTQALGLLGMRERAAIAGGTLDIESAVGSGTKIRIRLPLKEEERAVAGA